MSYAQYNVVQIPKSLFSDRLLAVKRTGGDKALLSSRPVRHLDVLGLFSFVKHIEFKRRIIPSILIQCFCKKPDKLRISSKWFVFRNEDWVKNPCHEIVGR